MVAAAHPLRLATMIQRYYTAAEIRDFWRLGCKAQVIYKFAHEKHWRTTDDRRRPTLYNADDVDKTMPTLVARLDALTSEGA